MRRLKDHAVAPPDDEIANWLLEQIEAEETYLIAARAEADELDQTTSEAVASVLARRRENLVVLQASALGGLTMGLAAAQALDYHGRIPGTPERSFGPARGGARTGPSIGCGAMAARRRP